MTTDLFDRIASSTSTPTSPSRPTRGRRVSRRKLHDQVPHIERIDGRDVWMADGERLGAPGYYSMAGYDGVMPASVPADLRRHRPVDVRREGAARVPRRAGHPRPGAVPERRRLRQRLLPAPRRPRARGPVRAGLQRLPHRLVQRRSRPAARHHRAAVLGRRPRHRRAPPLHRARATGRSTSATSRRTTASRRSPTATGTRSGPRPRRPACR